MVRVCAPRLLSLLLLPAMAGLAGCRSTPPGDAGAAPVDDAWAESQLSHPPRARDQVQLRLEGTPREGLVQGPLGPMVVSYEVIDGMAVVEGDILFDLDEVQSVAPGLVLPPAVGVADADLLWPGCEVAYELGDDLADGLEGNINGAIAMWEDRTACTFVEDADAEDRVLISSSSTGCSAEVGRRGGVQDMHLASWCTTGSIVHEFGHALGLWHEHTSANRDDYIVVNIDLIRSGKQHNYRKHDEPTAQDLADYDYGSIMHYRSGVPRGWGSDAYEALEDEGYDCSEDDTTLCVLTKLDGSFISEAQRIELSENDVAAVQQLYFDLEGDCTDTCADASIPGWYCGSSVDLCWCQDGAPTASLVVESCVEEALGTHDHAEGEEAPCVSTCEGALYGWGDYCCDEPDLLATCYGSYALTVVECAGGCSESAPFVHDVCL